MERGINDSKHDNHASFDQFSVHKFFGANIVLVFEVSQMCFQKKCWCLQLVMCVISFISLFSCHIQLLHIFPFRKCCKVMMRFDACSTHQCHAVVKRTLKFCLYHSSSQKGYRQFADYFRTLNLAKQQYFTLKFYHLQIGNWMLLT